MDDRSQEEKKADEERIRYAEIHKGQQAKNLLEDELFRDAVAAVRKRIQKDFESSALDDDRGRLVARLEIDVLERIVDALMHHVRTGEMSKEQLARLQ